MQTKIKNVLIFPVVAAYVMLYLIFYFVKLFLEGNYMEHILQLLFVRMQNRLDKLINRGAWFAPFVYALIVYKVWFAFCR